MNTDSPFSSPTDHDGEAGLVWVLEDSPLEAEMARRALATRPNTRVEIFTDSPAMLERLANGARPDALILDRQLPTLTGLEVCRFIRQTFDAMELPILILTVERHRSDLVEGLSAGANDYLTKPYDVAELRARASNLIRIRHLHRARARHARHLALTADIGSMLTQGGDLVGPLCAAAIGRHLDAAIVGIWTAGEHGLELVGHFGALEARHVRLGRTAGEGRRALVWFDEDAGARIVDESWQAPGARTFVELPLFGEARVIGSLAIATRRHLEPEETRALAPLGDLVALGLERLRGERERADLLERERRARAEAEAANRGKDEFLAVLSHELRGPLNAIAGWTTLLRAGEVAAGRVDRALATIERNTHAQTQLVEDLLDVSRIVSGKLTIDDVLVDIAQAVDGVVESMRPMAADKGIELLADVERVGDVRGDPARMRQVVTNLLGNAVKFTPKGGRVKVTLHRVGGSAELRVEDSGQGIEKPFLPHVFERFRQADGSKARRHGGLGLGLAIVDHLVALHGGTVRAESEGPGRGATFVVQIPLSEEVSATPASSVRSLRPSGDLRLQVIAVDDDEDARDLIATILSARGMQVRLAASVPDALALVREAAPDVIVTDVGMPGSDGFELLRRLRALPADQGGSVPVIALTAYASSVDRAVGTRAGFEAYLTKPPDLDALLEAVTTLGLRAAAARA